MVKLQFDLSDEEDEKLSLYKVRSGWDTKALALKCLIRKTINQHGELK